jgi:hypothetical protein
LTDIAIPDLARQDQRPHRFNIESSITNFGHFHLLGPVGDAGDVLRRDAHLQEVLGARKENGPCVVFFLRDTRRRKRKEKNTRKENAKNERTGDEDHQEIKKVAMGMESRSSRSTFGFHLIIIMRFRNK